MPNLPPAIVPLLSPFASLFDARTWRKVQILLTGVILAPGRRTVSTALYVLGLHARGDFALFHHVLSRAAWSSLAVRRVLLGQLVQHLVPTGPLRLAIDETLKRRWGEKIEALGVYRDPVRSSHGHFVKAKGLRWVSLMLLVEIPWANRVRALPFLTVRAPSERYHEARGRRHKTITDWARQMLCLLRRWLPDRELVVVGDRTYATLKLLATCQGLKPPITFLTRLRLDAVLHDPPPPRKPGQRGRPRVVGARQPSLQALLTHPATVWPPLTQRWPDGTQRHLQAATGTAHWYHPGQPTVSLRWLLLRDPTGCRTPGPALHRPRLEPQGHPRHLPAALAGGGCLPGGPHPSGRRNPAPVVGSRHWRSWLILVAHHLLREHSLRPRQAAWYAKTVPTFADVLGGCPRPPPTSKNSPSRHPHRFWPPSATRPDTLPTPRRLPGLCTKSSLDTHAGPARNSHQRFSWLVSWSPTWPAPGAGPGRRPGPVCAGRLARGEGRLYAKTVPTFADVLACVRHLLWRQALMSPASSRNRFWPPSATP